MCLVGLNTYNRSADLFNCLCFLGPKGHVSSFVQGRPCFSQEEAGKWAEQGLRAGVREEQGVGKEEGGGERGGRGREGEEGEESGGGEREGGGGVGEFCEKVELSRPKKPRCWIRWFVPRDERQC